MNIKDKKSFSGTLNIWDISCNFYLSDGYSLEIKPEKEYVDEFEVKCKELNGNYNSLGWLYGTTSRRYTVAFKLSDEQGILSYYKGAVTLIVEIILETMNSKDPSTGEYFYEYVDLHGFSAIDFMGDAIDLVFPPNCAIDREHNRREGIAWKKHKEYSKIFPTKIGGTSCNLIFTVWVDAQHLSPDTTSLGKLRTILRLEFEKRQEVSFIEPCWQAVCTFLAFCLGQFNVTDFDIALSDTTQKISTYGGSGNIDCVINDDIIEGIKFCYPRYNIFSILSLGDKTGDLFELLNDRDKKPTISFLKRTNWDTSINRNKIRDICTALELEFEYRKIKYSNDNVEILVKQLKDTVRVYRKEHIDAIEKTTYDYIFSSLSFISQPAREKFKSIYTDYKDIINPEFERMSSFSRYKFDLSDEQTYTDIAWIVKTRNNITHSSGITDQEIPNAIYARLTIVIFCSVLERAGYSKEEISIAVKSYFSGS